MRKRKVKKKYLNIQKKLRKRKKSFDSNDEKNNDNCDKKNPAQTKRIDYLRLLINLKFIISYN